ncbi:flavodoxin family protein [Streptococcus sp. NLN76]|uniref:flavodoxin family protein n=1 Tax=Streptococcus sp. NLN76 TaxID=2822800 RepID=UPI0018AACF0B|nr:flavodoxin family protein [Streptococcus sp. NLN76]MBF8970001.1 flavodoxin family protein [Streptococcus sp. NLN76]
MAVLFINGSPNKDGNTVQLASRVLENQDYETLHLVDYKIYAFGQSYPDDEFDQVMERVYQADTIVIGSPVYWHSLNGLVRNFLERQYGIVEDQLIGKQLIFLLQGAAPTQKVLEMGEYIMIRYAAVYGMEYQGMFSQ